VKVNLDIWDTGGQEQFRSMLSMYYRDADAALICYDVGNEKTFQSVYYWIGEMEKNCNNERDGVVLAVAGNKCDLESEKK
jgi:small GTP-binding protein